MNIDHLPFLYFVTSESGNIMHVNTLFNQNISSNIVNGNINDVFENWTTLGNELFFKAKIESKSCFFMKSSLEESRSLYIGVFTDDIDDFLNEVKELKQLNRQLDAIIENSYDGIYITDREGRTLRTNSAIERITGIPKEYYLNKKTDELMKRGILKDSVTHKVIEKKRTVSLVQLNYHGQETLLTGNPVFNEDGEIESVVTNIRDLTDLNNLQSALQKANELNKKYQEEIERLKGGEVPSNKSIIAKSEAMRLIYETARRIVNVDATVLILGETGVGKDVLAEFIFKNSERNSCGKFIKVNCGAIPPDLLESELFGYEGGAFTGANKQGKPGMFEMADKGVLFLDEIGEMPLNLQVKLLRVIQEREIHRIGGTATKKIDVRIIAATNRDLKSMVEKGDFREDLYYRLNVIPIHIPPLRERKEEILPLINLYLGKINTKYGMMKGLNHDLKSFFYDYSWPGNIRELSNLLERISLINTEDLLGVEHLPKEYQTNPVKSFIDSEQIMSLKEATEKTEERLLTLAAQKYKTTYEIAQALQTSQPTIVRKLKKYKIRLSEETAEATSY
jgi:PAS domain S-box-containing protein